MSFLNIVQSVGVQLTERLSLGANMYIGSAFCDGPFVGSSAMTTAYGIRGSVGLDYHVNEKTNVGFYFQSKEHFRFKDEVQLQAFNGTLLATQDLRMDLPSTIGLGVSNSSLADGKLLLAADVLFIPWRDSQLFSDMYRNQWTLQLGSQYSLTRRCKLRLGYTYAENPINPNTGDALSGIVSPGGVAAVKYLQAQFGIINQHRISAGVGINDVLPGLDFDAFAGGMLPASEQFGPYTSIRVESYWIGLGFTWRFGRGNVDKGPWTSDS